MATDNTQYAIDDNTTNDPEKGAALGGLGGAAVGAAAGSLAGPVGTIVGAVAGGLIGAGASGAAVAAIDGADHADTTVTGYTTDPNNIAYNENIRASDDGPVIGTPVGGHNIVTGEPAVTEAGNTGLVAGAVVGGLIGTAAAGPIGAVVGGTLGSLAGGVAGDAAEATDTPVGLADEVNLSLDNNYSGAAYQAGALTTPDVTPRPAISTGTNEDVLSTSTQTDYRSVDAGLTSVGATDTNADVAPTGGFNTGTTPGVSASDTPTIQSGGVSTTGSDYLGGDDRDVKIGGSTLNDDTNIGTNPADTTTLNATNSTVGQNIGDNRGDIVR